MALPGIKTKSLYSSIFIFLFLITFGCSCNSPNQNNTAEQQPAQVVNVPSFNADSAYIYTERQVLFGPRIPNSTAHDNCGDYLVTQLRQWCDTVIEQRAPILAYDGKTLRMRNIIGSFNPSKANRLPAIFNYYE